MSQAVASGAAVRDPAGQPDPPIPRVRAHGQAGQAIEAPGAGR